MKFNHKHTLYACCTGYITQAIVNNLLPLLFVTFNKKYGITLDKIGILITINFVIQMAVDFMTARYVDKFGYRTLIVFAHIASGAGLLLTGLSSFISVNNIYPALVVSVVISAIGGGLIEVLVSPMVEALPMENKAGTMSMLHSFYCWGQVGVTLVSTIFFVVFSIEKWQFLPFVWAIIPVLNAVLFTQVPIYVLNENSQSSGMKDLFKNKLFWIFVVLMICAGASELAMNQWSSYFTEIGLGVSKTTGDLLGPCMFAVLMGISRLLYSKFSDRIKLGNVLFLSSILCVICYIGATVSPYPAVSIAACALCGLSVGIMWPGVYSIAAKKYAQGGTVMFALLALAGDVGCSVGPSIVGYISNALGGTDYAIKIALMSIAVFPAVMAVNVKMLKNQ